MIGQQALRGTITQASPDPLRVRLDTSVQDAPATRIESYTPAVGHRVLVLGVGSGLVVVGREVA